MQTSIIRLHIDLYDAADVLAEHNLFSFPSLQVRLMLDDPIGFDVLICVVLVCKFNDVLFPYLIEIFTK